MGESVVEKKIEDDSDLCDVKGTLIFTLTHPSNSASYLLPI